MFSKAKHFSRFHFIVCFNDHFAPILFLILFLCCFFSSLISVRICVRVLVKYNLIVLCVWFVFYVHVFFFVCCCCEFYLKQNGGKSLPRSTKSFVFACFLLLRFYTDTLYLTTYSLTLCLLIRLVVFQLLFFWWIVLLSYLLSCFQLYSVFCLTAFVFTCVFFFLKRMRVFVCGQLCKFVF